jgi:diguanylate cyclase
VQDLASSADARAIAEAVIRLAHALERRVVAEGVETVEQRDLLVAMGCDELQGYLFARPMSAAALTLWAMDDGATAAPEFSASLFHETQPARLD